MDSRIAIADRMVGEKPFEGPSPDAGGAAGTGWSGREKKLTVNSMIIAVRP